MKSFILRQPADFKILLVALGYYITAELGYNLVFSEGTRLPFWPPAGLAFALIILLGSNAWPGIAIGSLLVSVKAFWFGQIESVQFIIAVSALMAMGCVLEALIGGYLVHKAVKKTFPFSTALHAFQFILIVLVISVVSSGFMAGSLLVAGVIPSVRVLPRFLEFWMSNVIGILMFTPLLLAASRLKAFKLSIYKAGELLVFILCVAGTYFLFSIDVLHEVAPYAIPFVVLPFLLWLAFRFNIIASAAGIVAVSLVAIYFTSANTGPFIVNGLPAESMLLLQIYIGVIAISTLVLASAVQERKKAQDELKRFNENLESIVQQRTKALQDEIAKRTEIQLKLQQSNDELTKRNTELDNFVYSVSHDLRAPMSSILGLINLAKKDKAGNIAGMYLDMMEKSARQQDYFIREILDQSRNARLEIKREPVRFDQLIEETFEQLNYSNVNGTAFEKSIEVNQPEEFYGDKWRIKVILNNIISNAIRYKNGRQPFIRVKASICNHKAEISVEDNGRGINKEHLPNLGKMFYRATDEGAGSGLGLYIVKEALAKLNGSFVIDSVEGEGTTVKVEIPEVEMA